MSKVKSFTFKPCGASTHLDDPQITGAYKCDFFIKAEDLPQKLPTHGNPREVNPDLALCDTIRESFAEQQHNTFSSKNRGLTIFVDQFELTADGRINVLISDEPANKSGAVDGVHTYETLQGPGESDGVKYHPFWTVNPTCPVPVSIRVGIPVNRRAEIAKAINRNNPVSNLTTLHHDGHFDLMKEYLVGTPMENRIQYIQNQKRSVRANHVVELMYVVRLDLFPSNLQNTFTRCKHPNYALTTSRTKVLTEFPSAADEYNRIYNILPELCYLYDYIEIRTLELYSSRKQKKSAFNYERCESTYTGQEAKGSLPAEGVLPMLSAFRAALIRDDTTYRWRVPFTDVKKIYDSIGGRWAAHVNSFMAGNDIKNNQIRASYLQTFAKDRNVWANPFDWVRLALIDYPEQARITAKRSAVARVTHSKQLDLPEVPH